MASDRVEREVRAVVEPLLGEDLLLERVEVHGRGARTLVRLIVDLADGPGAVGSDALGDVSREISDALDARDVVPGAYTLEVSSPGVDRPLTTPRHFRRAQGRLVRLRRRPESEGAVRELLGRVRGADEHEVRLDVEGAEVAVAYPEIEHAVVEVELRRVVED